MPKIEKYLEYPQDTRWATDEEIMSPISSTGINIAAPPYATAGLILKSDGKTVYVDGLDHHSMIIGSTGSGKSRLLCMPMIGIMANAGESFIVTDPKEELFKMTSGMAREQGYQVVVLNFRDVSKSDMWNPLLIPYELYHRGDRDHAMSLLNDFVMTLSAADKTQEQFWLQMAQSLILANILLLFEAGEKEQVNMHSLSRMCLDYGRPRNRNALYQLLEYINPDSIAGMNYAGVCVDAEKTQSSIMGVVHSILRVFNTQEELLRMMSDSSFDMRTFGRQKTAVYLIVPDEKSTFHFLVSTFTKQCYEMLIGEAHREEDMRLPVRVNFVLDEFANLPAIPDMPNMISAARSRNIRFHLVIQSMNQLFSKYGRDADTISSNCENWVYLNSKEYDCLEEISKRCGNLLDNRDQLRPLITPSRLQRLDKARGETLIFHGRQYPYISYLADISRYDFKICRPVEIYTGKRGPVSVFHMEELLEELKSGNRPPLFYENDADCTGYKDYVSYENDADDINDAGDANDSNDSNDMNAADDANDSAIKDGKAGSFVDEHLKLFCRRRMELAEASDFSGLLYYLLGTQKEMELLRRKVSQNPEKDETLGKRLEAEEVYRNSYLLVCCSVLAAESAVTAATAAETAVEMTEETAVATEATAEMSAETAVATETAAEMSAETAVNDDCYGNWLSGIYSDTICLMERKRQQMMFYPASSAWQNMAAAAGVAVAFHEAGKGRYGEADTILRYISSYRDCFLTYPGLDMLRQRMQRFLQAVSRKDGMYEMISRISELKQPVSFRKADNDSMAFLYRFRKESEQDRRNMENILEYCRMKYGAFLKKTGEKGGMECRK